jgi:hypothetical protein
MPGPGQWETRLAWLGAYLAGQDAHEVEVINRETFLAAAWRTPDGQRTDRSFTSDELARTWTPYRLRPDCRSRCSLLDTLGREIDRLGLDPAHIMEGADGFVVTGSIGGRYESLRIPYDDLGGDPAAPGQDETQPFPMPPAHHSPLRQRLHLSA